MNSVKVVFITFLVFSLGLISYLFITNTCFSKDEYICKYLKSSSKNSYKQGHFYNQSEYDIFWKIDGDSQEIVVMEGEEDIFHLVETSKNYYLFDQVDKIWWEQSRSEEDGFETEFIFNPKKYLSDLKQKILDNEKSMKIVKDAQDCAGKKCNVYSFSESEGGLLLTIDENGSIVRVEDGGLILTVDTAKSSIEIPEKNIKVAGKDRNIFLMNSTNNIKQEINKPDYLREFEKTSVQNGKEVEYKKESTLPAGLDNKSN